MENCHYNGERSSSPHGSNFRWENYMTHIVSYLSSSLVKESFVDVSLVSEDGATIQAHKLILSACSPYFERILESYPSEHPTVILKDVLSADLQAILHFMYNGEVTVDADSVDSIVKTAASLQIKGLNHLQKQLVDYESMSILETSEAERIDTSITESTSSILASRTPSPQSSTTTSGVGSSIIAEVDQQSSKDRPALVNTKIGKMSAPTELTKASTPSWKNEDKDSSDILDITVDDAKRKPFFGALPMEGKKKKDAWLDPDALSLSRRSSNQKKKRFKQPSLFSLALKHPAPKVDISKRMDYNGGTRSSQLTTSDSSMENADEAEHNRIRKGAKRKSEESLEGDDNWESQTLDLSETYFRSPSPEKLTSTHSHLSSTRQPQEESKLSTTTDSKKSLSPLSPTKLNIIESIEATPDKKSRHAKQKNAVANLQNSTMDILRDFDKIPDFKTPSPKKPVRSQVKKREDQEQLKCMCGTTDLALHVDRKELRRYCPIHGTTDRWKDETFLPCNTPENFWRTQQLSTQELYREGYIKVGTPYSPPKRTGRRNSSETFGDTENDIEL